MRSPFCALSSALVSRWPAFDVSLATSQVFAWVVAGAISVRAAQRAAPNRVRDLIQPRDVSVDDDERHSPRAAEYGEPSVVHPIGAREPERRSHIEVGTMVAGGLRLVHQRCQPASGQIVDPQLHRAWRREAPMEGGPPP